MFDKEKRLDFDAKKSIASVIGGDNFKKLNYIRSVKFRDSNRTELCAYDTGSVGVCLGNTHKIGKNE